MLTGCSTQPTKPPSAPLSCNLPPPNQRSKPLVAMAPLTPPDAPKPVHQLPPKQQAQVLTKELSEAWNFGGKCYKAKNSLQQWIEEGD